MTDRMPDVRVVTISWDDDNGLEVDYEGCSPYEAWAFLVHGVAILEGVIDPDEVDDE